MRKRAGSYFTEAILFGDIFYFEYCAHLNCVNEFLFNLAETAHGEKQEYARKCKTVKQVTPLESAKRKTRIFE
jgi:hypothetical protein